MPEPWVPESVRQLLPPVRPGHPLGCMCVEHFQPRPRASFFPGRRHIEEGTEHPWAVLRWREGSFWSTWTVRRPLVPPGMFRLLCRAGLHFMINDFLLDGYACRCRKMLLRQEDLRR